VAAPDFTGSRDLSYREMILLLRSTIDFTKLYSLAYGEMKAASI
jgi:hypothetical protein